MNQGNINQNANNGSVTPQPMPATGTPVTPQPLPATGAPVTPTPVNTAPVFAQAPEYKKEDVKPVQAPSVQPKQQEFKQSEAPKQEAVVAPTQTVVNTTKKKGGNILLFIVIILLVLFVLYIDDVLDYFNQKYSPTPTETIKEEDSSGLIDGYMPINDTKAFIKIKGIKFSNVRKSDNNIIYVDYLSDRNYSRNNNLNIAIQLYDSSKTMVYENNFTVTEDIESSITRQYKMLLEQDKYESAYYALILVKNTSEGN